MTAGIQASEAQAIMRDFHRGVPLIDLGVKWLRITNGWDGSGAGRARGVPSALSRKMFDSFTLNRLFELVSSHFSV